MIVVSTLTLALVLSAALRAQAPSWTVLTPTSAERAGDTQRIGLDAPAGWTALRLEIRPGKRYRLAEVRAFVEGAPGVLRAVDLVEAASTAKPAAPKLYHTIDRSPGSAWGNDGKKARRLYFRFAEAVTGKSLRVELQWSKGSAAEQERLGLAATTHAAPFAGLAAPLSTEWVETQMRINRAIDRGVQALIGEQELDGSWREAQPRYPSGQAALALYTLLKCGLDKNDPVIRRAALFVEAHLPVRTYEAACQIMALTALADPKHKKRIKQIIDLVVGWQKSNGFGYPEGAIDLSNTHYAALALHLAAKAGFKVPRRAWERLRDATLRLQETAKGGPVTGGARPLGFCYRPNSEPTGSMTAAGVVILGICDLHLRGKQVAARRGRDQGLAWLHRYFSGTSNPHPALWSKGRNGGHPYYYLYALERVGAILDIERIGPFDWYRHGALHLVDTQRREGSWGGQSGTCFALLFLTKATARAAYTGLQLGVRGSSGDKGDVSVRVTGENPIGMWIDGWGDKTLRQHGFGDGDKRRVHAHRVEWLATWVAGGGKEEVIHTVEASEGDARFPHRQRLGGRGIWRLRARAHIQSSSQKKRITVMSPAIEVNVSRVEHEDLVGYAADTARNLLQSVRLTINASSELSPQCKAANVADRMQGSAWISSDDDPMPSLTIELAKPVRAETLLITHAFNARKPDRNRTARAKTVEVVLNGKKKYTQSFEMNPDDWRKTRVSLPKRLPIRTISLRVVRSVGAKNARRGVGFGEVELLGKRKGR